MTSGSRRIAHWSRCLLLHLELECFLGVSSSEQWEVLWEVHGFSPRGEKAWLVMIHKDIVG